MAIDTRQKRFSMMNFSKSLKHGILFEADGAVDADDRSHMLGLYSGINLVGIPISFSGPVPNQAEVVGTPMSLDLSTYFSGSETPFTYTLQAGTLPGGLTLNPTTGIISGTPITVEVQAGIVVRGTDQQTDTADTNPFQITVSASSIAVTFSGTVPDRIAFIGELFSTNLSSYFSGTETPFGYTLQAGILPAGLALNPTTGVISGVGTTEEVQADLVVRATDQTPDTADTNAFTITMTEAPPVSTLVDSKFAALRAMGHTGAISDMTLQWLQANGAASAKMIPDAWRMMLDSKGFITGNRIGDWYALLGSLGYTGAMNDRELAFWIAGGSLI